MTEGDIRDICYEYAKAHLTKAHLTYDEPIPSFNSRYSDKLETALVAPCTKIVGASIYPTLPKQAAVLFYEMVKQHPFLNGNKRIACVSLMVFLSLNGKWFHVSWKELYDIAVTVATSQSDNREGVLKLLTDFVQSNIVKK